LFRVDRGTELASALARRYQVRLLPSLLIFDGQGQLVKLQQGTVDRESAFELVERILAAEGPFSCAVPLEEAHTPACTEMHEEFSGDIFKKGIGEADP
jgi:hypothetical protein